MRALCIVRWREGGGVAARAVGTSPGRSAEAEDALHVLLIAGSLLSLPALAWVLGIY